MSNTISDLILKMRNKYVAINRLTTNFFAKTFSNNSTIQTILSSDAVVLLINAALLAIIISIFGGLIGQIAAVLVFANIIVALLSYIFEDRP